MNIKRIRAYMAKWERRGYPEGIPDEAPLELEALGKVPSYRLICLTIMKNDKNCETLGYSRPKCEAYMAIKKAEIAARGKL
jgi:predicted phosphoadenosine phosphosulfate sulfurtransferase